MNESNEKDKNNYLNPEKTKLMREKSKYYDDIELIRQINSFENENENEIIFDDPSQLLDFVLQDGSLVKELIKEIRQIIETMNEILYTPPLSILFGRINIEKLKININENKLCKSISDLFYEGFEINQNQKDHF